MSSKYTVWTAWRLETGEVAVSGSVAGPPLMVGWTGSAQTSHGPVELVIVSVGVSDRTIGPPDRQGILVRMLRGEAAHLTGATIQFSDVQPQKTQE